MADRKQIVQLEGLTLGSFPGRRKNISAGQFRGRIGNTLSGLFSGDLPQVSASDVAASIPTSSVDLQALRSQGEQYYQQGVALVNSGKAWAAQAMNDVAKLNFDLSAIDWGKIANQGLNMAIDSLAAELSPSMQIEPLEIPGLPGTSSTAAFERALVQARTRTVAEQAKAAALLALRKQKQAATQNAPTGTIPSRTRRSYTYIPQTNNTSHRRLGAAIAISGLGVAAGIYFLRKH